MNMLYGYMLENTRKNLIVDNTTLIQLLQQSEVAEDCIYIDTVDDFERTELRRLIRETVKTGDTLIVRSIGDLSNNLPDLLKTLEYLYTTEVDLVSVEEPYYSYELYYMALKDFTVIDKQWKTVKRIKGMEKAQAEGRLGRKKDVQKLTDAVKLYKSGVFKVDDIRRIMGISNSSLYRALKEQGRS
ncbi:MAG: recombinase family protein, partial [Clostridiaceae bacterium]|nr:recombinase family protein [Clostridiaceae bacterium]